MITYYVVQSFQASKRGVLVADQPVLVKSAEEASAKARRLSEVRAGVVAFSRTGDATTGEYEDAVVIASYGRMPVEMEADVA
jgi:hypothetical protein